MHAVFVVRILNMTVHLKSVNLRRKYEQTAYWVVFAIVIVVLQVVKSLSFVDEDNILIYSVTTFLTRVFILLYY